jgi:Carboxypeptidase regulatory-like domain/TonB dependent receptor/TonB-dependent Receptor Plug Domain
MNAYGYRKTLLSTALSVCLLSLAPFPAVMAAGNDGSLVGQVEAAGENIAGAEIIVRNLETGLTRTVRADARGNYRFPFLPVGKYMLEVKKEGFETARIEEVRVGLGSATNVVVPLALVTLSVVEVQAPRVISAVDVSSVESASNFTADEIERLPVQRDAAQVALLAPGVNAGDPDLGGISFGGSSIAENTVYINGLNVTDFYNRVGFSSVPYAFFNEFQVKTGGYSVEFGRTTGGVINAVTRSGGNDLEYGAELVWEPSFLQTSGTDRFDADGNPVRINSYDEFDRINLNAHVSGALIADTLFYYLIYEARDLNDTSTTNSGNGIARADAGDDFWGGKFDWQINDSNLLELLAFSDGNDTVTRDYAFDLDSGDTGAYLDTRFTKGGGDNYALTWTSYLTDTFSVKALYGGNQRNASNIAQSAQDCTRYRDRRRNIGLGDIGCTRAGSVISRKDDREAARIDFEWTLNDHLLRFGLDREANSSDHVQFLPGPERLVYEIFSTTPGAIVNGATIPTGFDAYVRTRQLEVDGKFETINEAYYLEDNWQVSDHVVVNAGIRLEAFDNKNSDGDSYIKIDDMFAPRLGASWDIHGDGSSKLFGNAGRYFLPVANVINIKQAGGFLDERTFYLFNGLEAFTYNGNSFQRPRLGAQLGTVDNSQGDGTVGDLRGEVDADMDPVYQDEFILGFQSVLNEKWSWGVRGIYRKLTNAIDDMEITATTQCGADGALGFVMANPGEVLTVYGDTDCDGVADGYIDIDTAREGWALYNDAGDYIGQRGWEKPKRNYKALELVIDRAWDDVWSFNAAYTLSYSKGNAEGPVNSDTDFADAGRTEAFDNPSVNLNAYGDLPNDRRHQFKFRGSYALGENWSIGGTLSAASGRPISGLGVAAPGDDTAFYSFYTCVQNCTGDFAQSQRVYELRRRGAFGRTPWVFDVGASVSYQHAIGPGNLRATFSVFNLLNQERVLQVDEVREADIGDLNTNFRNPTGWQSPRFAQVTVAVEF